MNKLRVQIRVQEVPVQQQRNWERGNLTDLAQGESAAVKNKAESEEVTRNEIRIEL